MEKTRHGSGDQAVSLAHLCPLPYYRVSFVYRKYSSTSRFGRDCAWVRVSSQPIRGRLQSPLPRSAFRNAATRYEKLSERGQRVTLIALRRNQDCAPSSMPVHVAPTTTLVVRAFPPVAVLLVLTASALEPRADLVAPLARLQCLRVVGDTSFALRIRNEPPCNNGSLRVGLGGVLEDEAESDQRARGGHDHPPHPPPATIAAQSLPRQSVDNRFSPARPHAMRPRTERTIQINKHAPMNPAIR